MDGECAAREARALAVRPACRLAPTLIGARADREDPAIDIMSGRAEAGDKHRASCYAEARR